MKKYVKLVVAAAVLLCGLLLTGCGLKDAIQEQIEGTYDEWYKYDGDTLDIPLGNTDDEDANSKLHELKEVEVYVYFNPDDGLTVAIQAQKDVNVDLLEGALSTTVKQTMGGKRTFSTDKFSTTAWITLMTVASVEDADEPLVSSDPDSCIILDNLDNIKIQWKKVLANILINKILS